jgi:hypothetical protein
MRKERWYWLLAFCGLSVCIHLWLVLRTHSFVTIPPSAQANVIKAAEIEVTLTPLPPDRPTPEVHAQTEGDAPVATRKGQPVSSATASGSVSTSGRRRRLDGERPLPTGLPEGTLSGRIPALRRFAAAAVQIGGGGSPSPAPQAGGHDGLRAPEAPPEALIYNHGGAGGERLPRDAPQAGGGGSQSLLAAENPLDRTAVAGGRGGADARGGAGAGSATGVGYGHDAGVGTRPDGAHALATVLTRPGEGIGAAQGTDVGTHPPGGGQGNGAELPGTGGAGAGYGRGKGAGNGSGSGAGLTSAASYGAPGGSGPGISGSRGTVFGIAPTFDRAHHLHIVYLLDISGSMAQCDKIGKATEELKKALEGLTPEDRFDIITFGKEIHYFASELMPGTNPNVVSAREYVIGRINLEDWTFLSGALEAALKMPEVDDIIVLSDGEPHGGIEDFDALLAMVRERNTRHVRISALALSLGERFKGMQLLRALAQQNGGDYKAINLAK